MEIRKTDEERCGSCPLPPLAFIPLGSGHVYISPRLPNGRKKRGKVFEIGKFKGRKLGCSARSFSLVNLLILCRDYCIFRTHQQHNNSKESKKNIIIFISFKINPITVRLPRHSTPLRLAEHSSRALSFVPDLILI